MKELQLKVCGMRDPENIRALLELNPDYMGFIFYNQSPRFVHKTDNEFKRLLKSFSPKTKKVGVFVDEDVNEVEKICHELEIEVIQLHGNESPEYCEYLKRGHFEIIKVFKILNGKINNRFQEYNPVADYYLFEKNGKKPGGNNEMFNWEILDDLATEKKFFLSGGISPGNYQNSFKINNKNLLGLDINSGFEKEPGVKDIPGITRLINDLRNV